MVLIFGNRSLYNQQSGRGVNVRETSTQIDDSAPEQDSQDLVYSVCKSQEHLGLKKKKKNPWESPHDLYQSEIPMWVIIKSSGNTLSS